MTVFSDPMDHATDVEERLRDYEIQKVREQAKVSTKYTGICLYCGSTVDEPKLFCDEDCRQDYEFEQKMKKINGK
jgi:hypothetical protein